MPPYLRNERACDDMTAVGPSLHFAAMQNFVAIGGGLDRSAQHSNLLAKMECGHEAATSHLLFCGSAV